MLSRSGTTIHGASTAGHGQTGSNNDIEAQDERDAFLLLGQGARQPQDAAALRDRARQDRRDPALDLHPRAHRHRDLPLPAGRHACLRDFRHPSCVARTSSTAGQAPIGWRSSGTCRARQAGRRGDDPHGGGARWRARPRPSKCCCYRCTIRARTSTACSAPSRRSIRRTGCASCRSPPSGSSRTSCVAGRRPRHAETEERVRGDVPPVMLPARHARIVRLSAASSASSKAGAVAIQKTSEAAPSRPAAVAHDLPLPPGHVRRLGEPIIQK